MYSTILLEDFTSSLKSRLLFGNPVTAFVIGLTASLSVITHDSTISQFVKIAVRSIPPIGITMLERKYNSKLSPIINRFTTPIDKVVKSIKDGSFVTPNSKFFDIIQIGVTLLLLLLGFTIGTLILFKLRIIQKRAIYIMYKNYLYNMMFALTIAVVIGITKGYATMHSFGELQKVDIDKFKVSKNRAKRAVAKTYELVGAKYPKFTAVPLYYLFSNIAFDFWAMKAHSKNIVGIPREPLQSLTDDELVAIYLHEFGHLLNMASISLECIYIVQFLFVGIRFSTTTWAGILAEIGGTLFDEFNASVASFNREIMADAFAVSMGYDKQLKSALQKVEAALHSKDDEELSSSSPGFLTHPQTNERIENIEKTAQYFKQQTNELFKASTEIVTEELVKNTNGVE
jgi:Zn-dependent protease with chaperone function